MWSYIQVLPVPDQCGAIYRYYQYQTSVELYTGITSTRSMWIYIQVLPVPDQCAEIQQEVFKVDMYMKAG
jgi:hypothetical protein